MRRFELHRDEGVSGASGTGRGVSIFDLRRRGTHQLESPLVGPLPTRVQAAYSRPSVSTSPVCGAIDQLSGAVCTLPHHSDPIHEDRTDPLTAIRWRHDEHTTRRPEVATKWP